MYTAGIAIQIDFLYEWLNEKRIRQDHSKQPLKLKTTLHESCYVSELGDGFARDLRAVYKSAGADIVELPIMESATFLRAVSVLRTLNLPKSLFKEQWKNTKK